MARRAHLAARAPTIFAWSTDCLTIRTEEPDDLRPGVSRNAVDEVAAKYGLRLSDDAAAVWMWQDGDGVRHEDDEAGQA